MEDSRITELFCARSEQAIAELAKKYGGACGRIANNILNNALDAEECVNDAYLGVWNAIPPHRPDPLSAFVFRIVRNLAVKKYRSKTAAKRNSFYDAALEELEDCIPSRRSVENELSARETARIIDSFLDTLDRENRVIFVRRYWYCDSVSDIARRVRMSSGNVSVRLSRTREKLKKYLRKEGVEV